MCEQLDGGLKGREPKRCVCPKTTGMVAPE